MRISPTFFVLFLFFLSISAGGIADIVSKWVFRHCLAPERLKEILRSKNDEKAEGEPEEVEKAQEDTCSTAGQV